jgi:hypothetical protein
MSKNPNKYKYKKQKRHRTFPWPLAMLGGLLLVAAVFLFANRNGGGGTPNIAVDQDSIDYGYVTFDQTRQFKVKVTNTGDGILRFKEKPYIEVLEGC